MKDLSLDIIKDNTYFIKSPCDGEIIRFFVDKNDVICKDQVIAIIKKNNAYFEIESDFSGTVIEICTDIDESVKKWDDIVIVDIGKDDLISISVESPEYRLIYNFQQEILPKLIYSQTEMFLEGIAHEKGKFIHFLLNEVFKNNNMITPFDSDEFSLIEEIFLEKILVISMYWPQVDAPLLTRRSYILINFDSKKIQYFSCENSLDDDIIISGIVPIRGILTRYKYGVVPESVDDEKRKIIKIFIS